MITLSHYLTVSAIVFGLSLVGMVINRKNLIIFLMCIELLLLSININFIAFSHFLQNEIGEIFVFFILTVAAAESAIGLALLMVVYRHSQTINVDEQNTLQG